MGGGWGKRGSGVPMAQRVRGDLPAPQESVGSDCPARHCWVSGAVDAEGVTMDQLKEGANVKASYEERDGKNIVTGLEISE